VIREPSCRIVQVNAVPAEYGEEFLGWLRAATESAWSEMDDWSLEDFRAAGLIGARWQRGTRWTGGLTDLEIDTIERHFELQFPPDHRLFLQILHSTRPWQRGAHYGNGRDLGECSRSGFYDWRYDEAEIRRSLDDAMGGVVSALDRDDGYWSPRWGARPVGTSERRAAIERLVSAAPKLIPIFGHRFVVPTDPPAVLSMVGTDIIVYGANLRDYLLAELRDVLDLEPDWQPHTEKPPITFWDDLIHQV
jgi:hypothetical protein